MSTAYLRMPATHRALAALAAFAVVAVLVPAPARAQDAACTAGERTLQVGDPRLARYTPPAVDSMELSSAREGKVILLGAFTQHVQRTTENGTPALLFVQRNTLTRGVGVDSVWVDARTWAPLRHVATIPMRTVNVAYRNGRVTGRVTHRDSARTVDAEVPAGMFGGSIGAEAFKGLPLCDGAVIRVASYDPHRGPRETVYRVVGAERIEIGGTRRDVWTVDVQVGERTVRLHLDRATGRELQWSTVAAGGATMRAVARGY